jgi:hypothetical protein
MQWAKEGTIGCCKYAQVLDGRLEETFRDWYPHFRMKQAA